MIIVIHNSSSNDVNAVDDLIAPRLAVTGLKVRIFLIHHPEMSIHSATLFGQLADSVGFASLNHRKKLSLEETRFEVELTDGIIIHTPAELEHHIRGAFLDAIFLRVLGVESELPFIVEVAVPSGIDNKSQNQA
jgi:hypothetical protein